MGYFVQSWFSKPSSPIGVDFGSDCLRIAQTELIGGEWHLIAAASADVPPHVRNEPHARFAFFGETIRELITRGNFRGRRVNLCLPASMMYIQHLRMPKMDDDATKKGLVWELRGKIPFDPAAAVLRHIVAGEIYHDSEPKNEIIAMAARRDMVEQLLETATKARLDVAGMNVEPRAILDCFSRIYRRKVDTDTPTMFVDIGNVATRAMVVHAQRIRFARIIPVGGEHLTRAVAEARRITIEEARVLRAKQAAEAPEPELAPAPIPVARAVPEPDQNPSGESFAFLGLAPPASKATQAAVLEAPRVAMTRVSAETDVDTAVRESLARLIEELALCRRYYEATFANAPVQRMVFVGGEANQRAMCQQIARELGLAAQVGDPLVRIGKFTEVGIESGIDRRKPQPAWAVAIGLSMGAFTETPID
jgi:type IV pilus assembly protein PilM